MRAPLIRRLCLALTMLAAAPACNRERETLAQDLKNDRPEIRAGAVHRLGEMKDPQDLSLFLARAKDPSSMVRKAAAEALGTLGDARGTDALAELLGDPDEDVQATAAAALSKLGSDKARAYLTASFARRGTATRAAIAKGFGYGPQLADAVRKESDGIWDRNLKALEGGGAAERVGAAEELGRSGRPEAVERLMPLLGNDAILLAAGSARGLGWAGDKKAVPSLLAVVKLNYPPLREAAAQALGELGDPAAIGTLAPIATGADAAAADAASALAKLPPGPEANAALCSVASSSGDAAGVVLAAKAMAARGGCDDKPLLARLGKGAGEARLALAALAHLGAGKAEVGPKLVPLVEDKDPATRLAAIHTLGALGSPEAASALAKLTRAEADKLNASREKWVKEPLPLTYSKGFGENHGDAEFGTKFDNLEQKVHANNAAKAQASGQTLHSEHGGAPPEVLPDAEPEDAKLLAAAAAALGRVRAPEAQALLEPLATDVDDDIRQGALVGLAWVGGEANLKRLEQAWATLSPETVPLVVEALKAQGEPGQKVLAAGLSARETDRAPIAAALGQAKAVSAVEPLEKLLAAGGEESVAAAVALGELGQARSAKPLAEVAKDARSPAVLEAVQALGALKDPNSREALTRQLLSDRPEVRAAAVRALSALGAGPAQPAIEALRGDYYREVRRAVEQALGGSGSAQR